MNFVRARYCVFFCAIAVWSASSFAESDEHTPTNGDIFSRLCAEAVDSIAAMVPPAPSSAIAVVVDADSTTRSFFQFVILESLKKHFQAVFLQEANVEAMISLTVSRVDVRYENPFSESFLGTRKAMRKVSLQMRGTIVNAHSRQVMWAGTVERSFADTIRIAQINLLESSSSAIAKGIVPEAPFMERIIEPMVVVAAAGIAVYLFFTIRG